MASRGYTLLPTDVEDGNRNFHSRQLSHGSGRYRAPAERKRERLNTELLIAVLKSNINDVKSLLNENASKEAICQLSKCSVVHLAALRGEIEILHLLHIYGARMGLRDKEGRQPLHFACWAGYLDVVKFILDKDPSLLNSPVVELNYVDYDQDAIDSFDHNHSEISDIVPVVTPGSTPLHVASKRANAEIVDFLLSKHADFNLKDHHGMTALNVAGNKKPETKLYPSLTPIYEHEDYFRDTADGIKNDLRMADKDVKRTVDSLIRSGAGFAENDTMTTTLHTAVVDENLDLIDFLLEHGAMSELLVLNEEGDSPLHTAVKKKLFHGLKILLSWLSLEMIDTKNREGMTALHISVNEEWLRGVSILLEAGSSIEQVTKNKETALHIAARNGNEKLLQELLTVENALEVIDYKDDSGFTALFRAIEKDDNVLVNLLITNGASVTEVLPGGLNILHFAVADKSKIITQCILENTPGLIDCKTDDGYYPLHIAAEHGKPECVKLLLQYNANPDARTNEGETALHLAAREGHSKTMEAIFEYDIKCIQAKDTYGWTSLHVAACYGNSRAVKLLLIKGANVADRVVYNGVSKSALDLIVSNVPRSLDLLEDLFDEFIELRKGSIKSKNLQIDLDYDILLGPTAADPLEDKQLIFLKTLLNTINENLKERLILHPLVESFLFFKWQSLKGFFITLLIFYMIHTFALTGYAILTFVHKIPMNHTWTCAIVITMLVPIILTEIFHAFPIQRYYILDDETWIKIALVISSFLTVTIDPEYELARHFATLSVLLSWIELLFLLARFPIWGLHVLMFEKVTANIFQVLARFFIIFIGFLFAFMIHFEGAPPFNNYLNAICKVLVMVVELDYSTVFESDEHSISATLGRALYVAFLLLVAMVMTNLILGLAVSDLAVLEKQGRAQRLAKQTIFLSFLELCVYNDTFINCLPKKVSNFVKQKRSINSKATIQPNKPEEPLPQDIRYNLLAKAQHIPDENEKMELCLLKIDQLTKTVEDLIHKS